MQDDFVALFAYDQWANTKALEACRKLTPAQYAAETLKGSGLIIDRTLKECCRALPLVSLHRSTCRRELNCFMEWYNDARPHTTLAGQTPNERRFRRFPARRKPRYDPCFAGPAAHPAQDPGPSSAAKPARKSNSMWTLPADTSTCRS